MKLVKFLRGSALALATVGMLIPPAAVGANEIKGSSTEATRGGLIAIYDVALQPGGVLRGQAVDTQGAPAAATRVVLAREGKPVAATQTDAEGRFAFSSVKGGVYQLATAQGGGMYRVWAPGAAPPAAHAEALVIHGQTTVRGGLGGGGGVIGFLSNPWVLAGIVAAAIAIPLALDHNDGS
jgi:hypothetical protein